MQSPGLGERAQHAEREVSVLIIGGGPHALATLSALNESTLAFGEFPSDTMFHKRVGLNKLKKIGRVCVIDPGERFLDEWNKRFAALEIEVLRSPAFAHPAACEPPALMNFAVREGRVSELHNVPCNTTRLATEDMSAQQPLLQGLPSTSLFTDFCASLEAELEHEWLRGTATQLTKDQASGKFRVRYTDQHGGGGVLLASAVVLATGPAGQLNVPKPFGCLAPCASVVHVAELLKRGTSLAQQFGHLPDAARCLVIGGGLTAVQAALALVRAGRRVVLRSRRPLQACRHQLAWLPNSLPTTYYRTSSLRRRPEPTTSQRTGWTSGTTIGFVRTSSAAR